MDQPLPDLPSNDYVMISFCNYNSLVVLYAGDEEKNVLREAIIHYWKNGILHEINQPNCHHFVLNGAPFRKHGEMKHSIAIRLMVTKIFQSFISMGWKLLVSTDLSQIYDQTSLIFERTLIIDAIPRLFNIGLSSTDSLQLNNCSEDIFQKIRRLCRETEDIFIREETNIGGGSYQIKFTGNPWNSTTRHESIQARVLMKKIIEELAKLKFSLYANCDLKNTADTLFFKYSVELSASQGFAVISFNKDRYLHLFDIPVDVFAAVQETIKQHWIPSNGFVASSKFRPDCYELTLEGSPWCCESDHSINSRHLIVKIIECMSSFGYFIETGLDFARKQTDKAALLFKKSHPKEEECFCLAPLGVHDLALINAPTAVLQVTRSIVYQPTFHAIKEEQLGIHCRISFQWKPWECVNGPGKGGVFGRFLLLNLIIEYKKLGFRLAASFDATGRYFIQNKIDCFPDVNSWYFVYDETLLHSTSSAPSAPMLLPTDWNGESPPSYESATEEIPPPSYDDIV